MYKLTKKNLKIHNAKHKEQSVSEKINLWYLEVEQKKMEEKKWKGNEANKIKINHRATFKAICGL